MGSAAPQPRLLHPRRRTRSPPSLGMPRGFAGGRRLPLLLCSRVQGDVMAVHTGAAEIHADEREQIKAYRSALRNRSDLPPDAPYWSMTSTAICLSGGGIRSAAFAMGFLQAFCERRLLRYVDYLSAVSGGGYAAA